MENLQISKSGEDLYSPSSHVWFYFVSFRELSILLETTEETTVELFVSYVVNKAKWSPKYDIRVFSNDSTMKVSVMKMNAHIEFKEILYIILFLGSSFILQSRGHGIM